MCKKASPSPTAAPTPSPTVCTEKAAIDWTGAPRTGANTWAAKDTAGHEYDCKASSVIETASASNECECHNICHSKYGAGCGFYEFNAQAKTCAMHTTRCDKIPTPSPTTAPTPSPTINFDCPTGYIQVGTLSQNNDIAGVGFGQFKMDNIEDCKAKCDGDARCKSFGFGYANTNAWTMCEIDSRDVANNSWNPHGPLRMCKKASPSPTAAPTPSPTVCTEKAAIDWTGAPRTGATTWTAKDTTGQKYDCKAQSSLDTIHPIFSQCECHNLCHEMYGAGCGYYEFDAQQNSCAIHTTRCDKICEKKAAIDWTGAPRTGANTW